MVSEMRLYCLLPFGFGSNEKATALRKSIGFTAKLPKLPKGFWQYRKPLQCHYCQNSYIGVGSGSGRSFGRLNEFSDATRRESF